MLHVVHQQRSDATLLQMQKQQQRKQHSFQISGHEETSSIDVVKQGIIIWSWSPSHMTQRHCSEAKCKAKNIPTAQLQKDQYCSAAHNALPEKYLLHNNAFSKVHMLQKSNIQCSIQQQLMQMYPYCSTAHITRPTALILQYSTQYYPQLCKLYHCCSVMLPEDYSAAHTTKP